MVSDHFPLEKTAMASKTICVDFNGVLDTYTGWRGPNFFYPPREGARAFLEALGERGFQVVILTTFDPAGVRKWLTKHGMIDLVAEVTNKKVPALAYIDDRGITFKGNFEETLAELDAFRPYWQEEKL